MNYKRIYDDLMESRLSIKEIRAKERKQGKYFEAHHIIPECMGGEGSRGLVNRRWHAKNRVFSEETRRKISESKLGKPRDEQTKEKLRKAHTGKKLSPEHIAKIVEGNKRSRLLKLGQQNGDGVQGG